MGLCNSCAESPEHERLSEERSRALLDPLLQPHRDRLWEVTEAVQEQTADVHRFEEELAAERRRLDDRERQLRRKRAALAVAAREQRDADKAFQHMWQSQRWAVAFQGFYTMLLCMERRIREAKAAAAGAGEDAPRRPALNSLGRRLPVHALMLIRDYCVQRTSAKAILLRTAGEKHLCAIEERREVDTEAWRYYMFHDNDAETLAEDRARQRGAGAFSVDEDPKFLLSAKSVTSVVGHKYLISICPDAAAFRGNVIATLRSDAFGLRWTLVRHGVTKTYMDGENKVRSETGDEELVHIVYTQNITRSAPAALRVFVPEHTTLLQNGATEHPTSFNLVMRVRNFIHEMESGRAHKKYAERKRRRALARSTLIGDLRERAAAGEQGGIGRGDESAEETKGAELEIEEDLDAPLPDEPHEPDEAAGAAEEEKAAEATEDGAGEAPSEMMVRLLTAKHYGIRELVNAEPQWRADLQQFTLDFGGRVKESSARNFQLVLSDSALAAGARSRRGEEDEEDEEDDMEVDEEDEQEDEQEGGLAAGAANPMFQQGRHWRHEQQQQQAPGGDAAGEGEEEDEEEDEEEEGDFLDNSRVMLQFGRVVPKRNVGVNVFSLDFDAPFSPLAAFALGLAQSTTKIAC